MTNNRGAAVVMYTASVTLLYFTLKGVSVGPQCEACLVVNRALGRCVYVHFENAPLTSEKTGEEEKQHGGHSCIKEWCAVVHVYIKTTGNPGCS